MRTSVMVVVAAKDGIPAIEKWHDPAGVTILLGCFTALWLLAMWLGRNQSAARTHAASGARFAVHTTPSRAFALSLIVWLGLTMVLAEAWFHFHRAGTDAAPRWSVVEPADRTSYREIPIDPYAREQLRFNEGFSFGWRESDGSVWQLVSFRWLPARELRRRVEVALAKSHRPEICIRATGCTIKEELPVTVISVNGLSLPFRRIQFDDSGRNLNVFYCVWDEDTPADATANMRENTMSRLRAAWTGNRTVGQRVLEVAVWGVADWKQAEAMLRVKLEQFVRVENSPPRPVHTIFR